MRFPNRFLICSFLLAFLFLLAPSSAHASARTALVIGNGEYADAPLRNPVNDSRDMAETLKQKGFTVIHLENADRARMRLAVREFEGLLAERKGIGLFYFAGHGIQVEGRNYLVPVGADVAREFEVQDETILAESVLEAMAYAKNELNIVILDACRNNPFPRSFRSATRGLARMKTVGSGMLIAYATGPGAVAQDGEGRNGLYTRHLLEAIATPGLSIEQVFKTVRQKVMAETNNSQTPWEESSLTGDFYFSVNATATAAGQPQPVSEQMAQPSPELIFWQGIAASRHGADYEEYLRRYPDGVFASLARSRLASLTGSARTVETPPASENGTARSVGEYPAQLLGTWQYRYTENKTEAYLRYSFSGDGSGSVEGEDPDGSWWAERVQWQVQDGILAARASEEENTFRIVAVAAGSLTLLGLKGDLRDEQLVLQRVSAETPPSFDGQTRSFAGTWKDTWQDEGKTAFQIYTLRANGTFRDEGKTASDQWSAEGVWHIDNDLLILRADDDTQKYRIVRIRDKVMDLIDLSPEYLGQGTRFFRVAE
jgi:uncharacterized caspase-like protein